VSSSTVAAHHRTAFVQNVQINTRTSNWLPDKRALVVGWSE
jgi:hypothetical protein